MSARIGIDLGGTKILAVRLEADEVAATEKVPTPAGDADTIVAALAEVVSSVDPDNRAGQVGLGLPGLINAAAGTVRSSPNIPAFADQVPIGELLARVTGRQVLVDNDVNVATVAEHRVGAGRGVDDLLCVFLGTGVGGGLVLDGRLRRGPRGLAGEIGHLPVVFTGGEPCSCGGLGHLEAYAGRASLERRARAAHEAGTPTLLVEAAGSARMKSKVWRRALDAGDELARRLIDEATEALVAGLCAAVVAVDVELVILGGGLAHRLGDDFRRTVEDGLAEAVFADEGVPVRSAALGDESGAVGAAHLGR